MTQYLFMKQKLIISINYFSIIFMKCLVLAAQ